MRDLLVASRYSFASARELFLVCSAVQGGHTFADLPLHYHFRGIVKRVEWIFCLVRV